MQKVFFVEAGDLNEVNRILENKSERGLTGAYVSEIKPVSGINGFVGAYIVLDSGDFLKLED